MMEGSVKLKKIKNQIGIGHSHAVEVEEKCLKETYVVMNIISVTDVLKTLCCERKAVPGASAKMN